MFTHQYLEARPLDIDILRGYGLCHIAISDETGMIFLKTKQIGDVVKQIGIAL
jgi:hypothetical protein